MIDFNLHSYLEVIKYFRQKYVAQPVFEIWHIFVNGVVSSQWNWLLVQVFMIRGHLFCVILLIDKMKVSHLGNISTWLSKRILSKAIQEIGALSP